VGAEREQGRGKREEGSGRNTSDSPGHSILDTAEVVPDLAQYGIRAFTTTRESGSFGMLSSEPVRDVTHRWSALRQEIRRGGPRFATGAQVHGSSVAAHAADWEGWLRVDDTDGHISIPRGTGLAVTVADCVPVFLAHASGAVALLHAGWRGTAANIVACGVEALAHRGIPAAELRVHLGPAICGTCYEVGPDVYEKLTGSNPGRARTVDVRALIARQCADLGIQRVTISDSCTRCDNDRFFSHRAGDEGRQVGLIIADAL
jgi:YfiH family protein